MGYNFRPVERDQQYLLPPSVRDWLPEDDLAWVVLDAVDQFDLDPFRARYRVDGWGAAAFHPALMVALLLYAYATGERSSRRIEALCRRDVAYRVICANQIPDHATIARFRADHEAALAELFGQILRLCAEAGLVRLGLVALDGTKLAAATSLDAARTVDQLDAEISAILAQAAATDAAEDAALGPDRTGDELPAGLSERPGRLTRLVEARRRLRAAEAERTAAHAAHAAERAASEASLGRPLSGQRPKPLAPRPEARINPTDPDSRKLRGSRHGWLQGYNGQALVTQDGVALAAELTTDANDVGQLGPMLEAGRGNLAAAGVAGRIGTVVADAGYWSEANAALEDAGGPRLLIKPASGRPRGPASTKPIGPGRVRMRDRLARARGQAVYRRRCWIVEPVFGQLKEARGVRRFSRRGYRACASEWRLLLGGHNLLKLWRYGQRSRPTGPKGLPPRRRASGTRASRNGA